MVYPSVTASHSSTGFATWAGKLYCLFVCKVPSIRQERESFQSKQSSIFREGVNAIIYEPFIQDHLVQAQYWHDPLDHQKYVEKSQFIAEINNEGSNPNATYADNLMKLEKMVLVMFSQVRWMGKKKGIS